MAHYTQIASGNPATAANLGRVTAVATAHASNTTSDFHSTPVYTDTYTAPSLTDKAVGVGIFLTSNGMTDGSVIRATLQEDAGAGFVDTACTADVTITGVLVGYNSDFLYFQAGTPYTFTTTTANKYRWKLVRNSGSGSLLRARSSTTGSSTPWAWFVDSRNGSITSGDILCVPHGITSTGANGLSFGASSGNTGISASTFASNSLTILGNGIFEWDTSANTSITIKGGIVVSQSGEYRIGSEATPYPSSYVATFIHDQDTTAGNYGLWTQAGNITINGAAPTAYAVKYVSGLGTAASPMITDGDIGVVGDEVLVSATGSYNQTEYKFIKTKNSATSYVLSDTVGGAEAALTYTHSANRAKVANLQRNIIIKPANSTYPNYILHTGQSTTGRFYGKNFRTEYIGNSGVGKFGVTLGYSSGQSTMVIKELSGIVSYRASYSGFYLQSNRTDYTTYSDNIFCRSASSQPGATFSNFINKTMNRWYFFDNAASAIGFNVTANAVLNDHVYHGNNTGGGTNGGHYLIASSSNAVTINRCDFQTARIGAIRNISANLAAWVFNDCKFGDIGTNTTDITTGTNFNDILFSNCLFGSATLISGYTGMVEGSEVRFQRYNQSTTSHRWYTPHGKGRSETTTKRTGSISLAIEPEDATNGFVWEFYMPANANQQIFLPGYFYRSALSGDVTVDIYLPYSTTPDATFTLDTTLSTWKDFIAYKNYAQSENEVAKIRITVKGASGTIFFDDFLNGGNTSVVSNNIASFETWQNGKPVSLFSLLDVSAIPAQSAQQVWNYSDQTTSANTMGQRQVDAADDAELAAIK